MIRRTSSALAEVKSVTSTCVTPAYRRSALLTGQHISSTQVVARLRGELGDFGEGQIGKDGADEAELHGTS